MLLVRLNVTNIKAWWTFLTEKGLTYKVYPFVLEALGAWTKDNEILSVLKIPSGYRRMLRQLIVSDTIRGSDDIWSAFSG